MENTLEMQAVGEETAEKKEQIVNIDFKMVTFALAGKDYAIDILKVKEIAKAGRFTYVPNSAPFVIGVYNLRGEIIPIIDLRLFFNIDVPERSGEEQESIIIISFGEQKYGVVVDRIDKVVGIQSSTIQPPHPLFGDINIKYIYGVVETSDSLYILLDVDRIFGFQTGERCDDEQNVGLLRDRAFVSESAQAVVHNMANAPTAEKAAAPMAQTANADAGSASQDKKAPAKQADTDAASEISEPEFSFIVDSLASFKHFYVSDINENWAKSRYMQWKKERSGANVQILNEADADAFLSPFYSQYANKLWSNEYAAAVYALLPESNAKQIQAWNPGCGNGYEAYSLACLLKKRYPNAKIRVYAQDTDLIAVSNAPLLHIDPAQADSWYNPYLSKTVSGEMMFAPQIRDSVSFEYHDCTNTNSVSPVDIIYARDFLSFVPKESRQNVLTDFYEKIRGNGFIIVGDNEALADKIKWLEITKGSVITYTKQ